MLFTVSAIPSVGIGDNSVGFCCLWYVFELYFPSCRLYQKWYYGWNVHVCDFVGVSLWKTVVV